MDREPVASSVNPSGPVGPSRIVILLAILLGNLAGGGLSTPMAGAPGTGLLLSQATVQQVIDGDTIEVSTESGGSETHQIVRYLGIDTPELRRRGPNGRWIYDPQPYAEAAFDANRQLVEGRQVRLEYDMEARDRYGRLLAYVYAKDRLVNAELVERGLARAVPYPPNTRLARLFFQRQQYAKAHRRGLWEAGAARPKEP